MKRILVTGGAGYIGAHTAHLLLKRGYDVIVVDDLSRGYRHNVEPSRLRVLSLGDTEALSRMMARERFDAVVHFAAYALVGESSQKPEIYFSNNVGGSVSLLTAMLNNGVSRLVFSSTAAVYGIPDVSPIPETVPRAPVNAYGESKAMVEKILGWMDQCHGIRSVCLRYFNACGADGKLGEEHDPETHLIPLILRAILTGQPVTVFGDDYPTPDGTCIRDYIHVSDLAEAHILALEHLLAGGASDAFNVGTGVGHSVKEVLAAAEQATARPVPFLVGLRREGDPPELVADSRKLQQALGWKPRYTNLREIVETAWRFASRGA